MSKSIFNPDACRLIDEYINSLNETNQKICNKIRELIHQAVPDIVEDWKWGPNFNYKGMLCGFAGFKNHATLAFFNGSLLKDTYNLMEAGKGSKNNRNIKFSDVSVINDDILIEYFVEAADNNQRGIKSGKIEIDIPDYIKQCLIDFNCLDKFRNTNYTNQKEYILWIENAKQAETRSRRLNKAISQIEKGIKFGEKII